MFPRKSTYNLLIFATIPNPIRNLNTLTFLAIQRSITCMSMRALIPERIRRSAALTQKEVAERAGLSTLYVIRAEQGLPATLGDHLATLLSELDVYGREADEINRQYGNERTDMLSFYYEQINANPGHKSFVEHSLGYALDNFHPGAGKVTNHPLYLFRTHLMELHELPTSAIKFCTMFNIHPSFVSNIEKRQDTIEAGTVIDERLKHVIGLSEVQAEMLRKACDACL